MGEFAKPLGTGTASTGALPDAIPPTPADSISAGALAGSTIRGGNPFTDTLPGVFYPVVIDAAGNVTVNSSANRKTAFTFHDTGTAVTDLLDYTNNLTRFIVPNSATTIALLLAILDRNTLTGANGIEIDPASRRIFFLSNGGGGNAAITWDNASALTFNGSLSGTIFAHGNASLAATTGSPGSATSTVSFGKTFSSAPDVIISVSTVTPAASFQFVQAMADTITTTNFRYLLFNWGAGVTETVVINWIAVGPA